MQFVIRVARAVCLSVLFISVAAPTWAQTPAKNASEFYMQYRKAFDAAKKVEDILPYMSKTIRGQIEATPAVERAQMFGMLKVMGALTDVKISKETPAGTGATLVVDALDSDKAKISGTISVVKESGAWKIDKEDWTSGK